MWGRTQRPCWQLHQGQGPELSGALLLMSSTNTPCWHASAVCGHGLAAETVT